MSVFKPYQSLVLSGTTTSSNDEFDTAPAEATHVSVYNSGSVAVRVEFGTDNTTEATADSYVMAPGQTIVLWMGANTWIAVETVSSTATVYATKGIYKQQ